jgi:hypothetical protein
MNTYFKRVPHYFCFYLFFVWFFFMALAVAINYYHGFVKESPYPLNSIFPAMKFGDFYGPMTQWLEFDGFGQSGYGVLYFPATYLTLSTILHLTDFSVSGSLQLSLLIWFFGSSFISWKFLRKDGFLHFLIIFCLIILSYPSIFIFATGNFEGWIGFLLMLAGALSYFSKWNYFAIVVGFAGAMKGVPLIFILLPLSILKFRLGVIVAFKTFFVTVGITIFSLFVLPGGYLENGIAGVKAAISGIAASQEKYADLMVNSIAGVHYGHSFLNAVHAVFGMEVMPSQKWGPIVFVVLISFLCVLLYLQRIAGTETWIRLLSIGAIACLAVATSTDYKLVYLAPALLLATKTDLSCKYKKTLLMLTVFAMAPKPWLYVGTDPFTNASVYLTSVALLTIVTFCYLQAVNSLHEKKVTSSLQRAR